MRRVIAASCVAGLLLAGCSSDTDDVPDEAPTPAEVDGQDEPATTALETIAELPAVSIRSLELPEVPEGMDALDVHTAADTVRSMAQDAFNNRERWDAGPTSEVQRSHLGIAGPDFAEQVETSGVLSDGAPTAQLFVSVFDPDAQPIALPRVVAARWDVRDPKKDGAKKDGEDKDGEKKTAPLVSLQVHAMYLVGDEDEPRAILMRRTIGIGGNHLDRLDASKDWVVETQLVGADTCAFYTKGLLEPSTDEPDTEAYETFLAEAESEEIDEPVDATPDLADVRAEACD